MKTELVRIGNSRGVRIPKPFIEQCGFGETVELRVANDCLIISPGGQPRQGWDDAFRASSDAAHDELMLEIAEPNEFGHKEWRPELAPSMLTAGPASSVPPPGVRSTTPVLVLSRPPRILSRSGR